MYFEQVAQPDINSGNIWMQTDGSFVKIDPKTDVIAAYPIPPVYLGTQNSMDTDSKGRVWANGRSGVVEYDPSEGSNSGVMHIPAGIITSKILRVMESLMAWRRTLTITLGGPRATLTKSPRET